MSVLQTLGWTLLHTLWQAAAIALLAWSLLSMCRSARLRYTIGLAGMVAMLGGPAATFTWLNLSAPQPIPDTHRETAPRATLEQPLMAVPIELTAAEAIGTTPSPHAAWMISWLGRGWVAGVILVAAWNALGMLRIGQLRRESFLLEEPEWTARLMRLIRRFHLREHIALLVTDQIDCPAVVGWLKPVILWPSAALTGLTPRQVDALLAHELAHIRRHDFLINIFQAGAETVLFFHPCAWWLSRRVRQERENCCDDLAAQLLGSRVEYAEALVAMESLRQAPALSLSANGGSLMNRIQRLIEPTSPALVRARSGPAAVLLLAGVVTLSLWSGRAAPTSAEPSTQPTTEVANTDANSLRVLLTDVVNARDAARELRETKSAFAPEVTQAQERERAAMQKWTSQLFELCRSDNWDATLEAELKKLTESNADSKPLVTRGDLAEIIAFAAREARLQFGDDSDVAKRLASRSATLKTKERTGRNYEMAVNDNQVVEQLAKLSEESERLGKTLGPQNPKVREMKDQIARLHSRLADLSEAYARASSEKAAKIAREATAEFQRTSALLNDRREELHRKLEVAGQSLSADSPTIYKLRAELEALDASLRALFEKPRDAAQPQESAYARYLQLTKDRDALTADIKKHRDDPSADPEQLAEMEGLLQMVNLQIGTMTNSGEVYVGGKIPRPGVYSISGRQITLKQMLISAGLAKGSDDELICIIRRDAAGRRGEETIYRQMSELFGENGDLGSEKGDLPLQRDDQIMVGVNRPRQIQPTTQPGN